MVLGKGFDRNMKNKSLADSEWICARYRSPCINMNSSLSVRQAQGRRRRERTGMDASGPDHNGVPRAGQSTSEVPGLQSIVICPEAASTLSRG